MGYEKIYILIDTKLTSEHAHIPLQLDLAKSMIKGVVKSFNEDFIKIIDNNDPEEVSKVTEIGVPTVSSRIAMMEKLSKAGWKIGLRLDPLIYHNNYKSNYKKLINKIFYNIGNESFHSVSVGAMRFPKSIYNKIERL